MRYRREYQCWLGSVVLLAAGSASAGDIETQVQQFFQQLHAKNGYQVVTHIQTPAARWPQCEQPQLALPSNGRRWGNLSLSVSCDTRKSFLQVQVEVTGSYLVAARHLSAGKPLTAIDLRSKRGRLDRLPANVLLDSGQAIGALTLRNINPGQPLTASLLRRPWAIKAGQSVQVLAQGEGFTLRSEGIAINNAAADEPGRVRMKSGQIVSGMANADGTLSILL